MMEEGEIKRKQAEKEEDAVTRQVSSICMHHETSLP
jgi:hypothetical protein